MPRAGLGVGNLHSVALIDLKWSLAIQAASWEPSFCSLDRLKDLAGLDIPRLGTFIL